MIMPDTEKPYWSWLLKVVTFWMPKAFGIEPALRGPDGELIALATVDRNAVNFSRRIQAEDNNRPYVVTGNETREVVHTGAQLPLRGKTIYLGDVLDVFEASRLGYWGKLVHEEAKGTKVELRLGEPQDGSEGVIPLDNLLQFITTVQERTVSVRAVWINPGTNPPSTNFANLAVSTPEEHKGTLVTPDELFVFGREGLPRLGSRLFKPRDPSYQIKETRGPKCYFRKGE